MSSGEVDRTPEAIPDFLREMKSRGWVRFDSVVPQAEVEALRAALAEACEVCEAAQRRKGLTNIDGTAHHVLMFEGAFMDFLTRYDLDAPRDRLAVARGRLALAVERVQGAEVERGEDVAVDGGQTEFEAGGFSELDSCGSRATDGVQEGSAEAGVDPVAGSVPVNFSGAVHGQGGL